MIGKGEVLLRIEDFQQGRRRIAAKIRSDLVDLVQHEDGVVGLGPPDPLNNASGQGPHIGSAVPPDFSFVAYPAQGDPVEFSSQGLGDGPAQGGLARSRRAGQAQDRSLGVGF